MSMFDMRMIKSVPRQLGDAVRTERALLAGSPKAAQKTNQFNVLDPVDPGADDVKQYV